MKMLKDTNVATTEYAVEVNDENGFNRQIDVFSTYEEATSFAEGYSEPLYEGEYLNIIFIDYNKDGEEICFGTVA